MSASVQNLPAVKSARKVAIDTVTVQTASAANIAITTQQGGYYITTLRAGETRITVRSETRLQIASRKWKRSGICETTLVGVTATDTVTNQSTDLLQ